MELDHVLEVTGFETIKDPTDHKKSALNNYGKTWTDLKLDPSKIDNYALIEDENEPNSVKTLEKKLKDVQGKKDEIGLDDLTSRGEKVTKVKAFMDKHANGKILQEVGKEIKKLRSL